MNGVNLIAALLLIPYHAILVLCLLLLHRLLSRALYAAVTQHLQGAGPQLVLLLPNRSTVEGAVW